MVIEYGLHTHLTTNLHLFVHSYFIGACAAVSGGVGGGILFVFLQRECSV